jgi:hypothetical protein
LGAGLFLLSVCVLHQLRITICGKGILLKGGDENSDECASRTLRDELRICRSLLLLFEGKEYNL